MGEIELLDLYWTSAGPVDVHVGREWSAFGWSDRCAQASRVGFAGLGLWHADVEHQLQSTSLDEMRRIFDDAGLHYLEVEFLDNFFCEPGTPEREASDERRQRLFQTAAAFDAHHIKVGNIPGTPCPVERLTEEFAALCDEAAQRTDAKVVYEFMPFDVNVHDLGTALAVVQGAGRSNGALAIDTWHMSKLGIEPGDLRRVPESYLGWVELSDGQFQNMDDRIDETVNHRRLPGDGEFDVRGYVEACQAVGYDQPWGVEVLSADLRSLPIEQEFERAYETTRAQFGAGVA